MMASRGGGLGWGENGVRGIDLSSGTKGLSAGLEHLRLGCGADGGWELGV